MSEVVAAPVGEVSAPASGVLNEPPISAQPTATEISLQPSAQLPGWYSSIQDEGLRGYAEAKGFNSLDEVAMAYKQLDDLGLAERSGNTLIKPNPDDAESMANFYKAIGRPDSPEGYKLLGEGQAPTEFTNTMAKLFHEQGLTAKQAEALSGQYNQMLSSMQAQQEKQFEVESSNQMEALKQEWGSNYGRNVEMFRRGVKGLGVETAEFQAIEKAVGTKRAVEIFKNAASGFSEAQFRSSNDGGNFMSPEGAQAELDRLTNDKVFRERIVNKDVSALEKWERLNRLAMGE